MVRQARLGAVVVDEGEQVGVEGGVVAGVQAMPGAGVDGEAGSADEFGNLAAGDSMGADASWSPCTIRAGTWIFGSSARMSTSALTVSVSSSTGKGVSTIIRMVQSTRPGDAPGLVPK
jgi:hypothetical protein